MDRPGLTDYPPLRAANPALTMTKLETVVMSVLIKNASLHTGDLARAVYGPRRELTPLDLSLRHRHAMLGEIFGRLLTCFFACP